jgi:amino acid transporter
MPKRSFRYLVVCTCIVLLSSFAKSVYSSEIQVRRAVERLDSVLVFSNPAIMPGAERESQFLKAEHLVELHSTELRKELRLRDLVAIQILYIVGLSWVGTAARLGSSHIVFWLGAVVLFYIPSGIVVTHLASEMPLEGGIYQWAKLRFGALAGFMVAWNLWLYAIFLISRLGIQTADNLAYALGPPGAWIAGNKLAISAGTALIVCGLMLVAWRGLALGKWINGVGSFGVLLLFAAIILVGIPHWITGKFVVAPVAFTLPAFTLFNLNILGKMGFGAFGGFDGVAVFAGECRDGNVASSIRRSVWVAAPLISGIFILGTASVLTFVKPDAVDLVSPITQVLSQGAPSLKAVAATLLVVTLLAQNGLSFSLITRLPMVAGWDHLLPSWFSRLHPRYRTPSGSIAVIGAVSFLFAMLANFDSGNQEAFQLLDNAAGILFGLTYLTMFAIPLVAGGEKPGFGVRLAAASGFLMTLLFVTLSVFPIIEVANAGRFTAKVIVVILGLQGAGALYFRRAQRRARQAISPSTLRPPPGSFSENPG